MQIDIEIPDGLNPKLAALGWLVGRWEGTGHGKDHADVDFRFEQRVEFSHNGGDYLLCVSQTFLLDEHDKPVEPLDMETSFWRPAADASLEVALSSARGWTEVLVGRIQVTRIDLLTDAVVRLPGAVIGQVAEQRLYGKVEGDLMYAIDRATTEHELRPHMWARLQKQA